MENAQRPVVLRDLSEVLLPLYDVPESDWERYLAAARDARKPRWWEAYAEDGALTVAGELYLGLEQGASRQRIYQPQLIPGLLQVADYVRAVVGRSIHSWNNERIEEVVDVRMRRQSALMRATEPLMIWAVLDEASLRRMIGGRATMQAQLNHLVQVAQRPNITLQLLPFSIGAHHGLSGGFVLLEFAWPEALDPGIVFLEDSLPPGRFLEGRKEVETYVSAFEQLCALGWGPDATVEFIERLIKEYV